MPNLDTLSIQFNANGTERAIKNIKAMGYAVRSLANSIKMVDASKLSAFTSAMASLKGSVPTNAQTARMVAFANSVHSLNTVIGSANISGFSKDMATLGDAVNTFKKSSVNSITNAVTAMQQLGSQAQSTANIISDATSKNPTVSVNDEPTVNPAREIVATLERAGSRVDAIKSKFKGIFIPTKQFKNLEEQADKVAQKYDKLRQKMQEALDSGKMTSGDDTFKKQSAELDALRQQYQDLILKQKELAQAGEGVILNPTLKSSLDAFKTGFSNVTNIVKNGFVAGIRSANAHIKSFASRIKQGVASLKNSVSTGRKATDMAKKFANEIFRVSKMLKLMITRMALRKVIAEVGNGFKSLALHSEQFNASMSNLINGSKQLGYSFAAMVSPLINALAPALTYVIDLLTKFINIVNQILSALTGASTWNRAKEFTGSWADEISEANENAKELKKTVLGFDQLNQLQDNKSSSSGSGIKDMFETVDIDPKWKEFAQWLKDMWSLGDFTDLGKKLGEGLRDILESIPWDKIRDTSHKLGEALATLINGFVEVERLGYDIGNTIAQSVNTVFEFLNGFVHKLHWDSIGKFIADTFNGFFENIDWVLIKDTVVTGMAGLAEAIQSFIENFHWDNISNTIINGVDTIVSGVRAFVEGIEWKDFGGKIGEQIRKSIEGIDWKNIGETLGSIIQAAIDWTTGLLEELPSVETLIQKATDLLDGLFDKVDSQQMGENLATIMNGIYDFLVGFWNENGPAIKAEVKKFFEGFWDTVDKEALKKVIGNILFAAIMGGLISLGWTTLKLFLAEKFKAMISGAVTNAAANPEVVGAAEKAGEVVFGKFAQGMIGTAATIDIWQSIKSLFKLDKLEEEMNNGKISLTEFWDSVKDLNGRAQSQASLDVLDSFRQVIRVFPDDAKRLKDELDKGIITQREYEDSLNKLAPAAKNYETELGKLIEDYQLGIIPTSEEFNEKLDTLKGKFKDAGKSVDDLKTPVIKIRDDFDAFKTNVDKNTAGVSNAVNSIKLTPLSDEATRLDTNTSHAFDNINRNAQTFSRTINQDTKAGFDSVKLNSKIMTENVPQEVYGATTTISGYVKTLSLNTDKETKTGFTNAENNSKPFTVQMPKEVSTAQKAMSDSVGSLSKDFSSSTTSMKKDVDSSMTDITKSMDTVKKGMDKSNWTFSGVADGLRKTFEDAKNGIKGVWNSIADTLNGEHDVGGTSFHINLPRFARGGFPEDGLFMANHHELVGSFSNGKTAVANNQQIIAGIESGVYNAMVKANGQGGDSKYIANEIIVDGEVLARSVTKAQEKQNRRYSPSMA